MPEFAKQGTTYVAKPWGYELIWAHTASYAGKILHVRAGESLSLQLHELKDETQFVLRGRVALEVGGTGGSRVVELGPGEAFHIPAGVRHRLTALEDSDVLEASTPELDDVVRFEDRYGRTTVSLPVPGVAGG